MVRPQKNRRVAFNPEISYFKPRGIPMFDLEEVRLTVDQREAIRLSDLLGLSHEDAGRPAVAWAFPGQHSGGLSSGLAKRLPMH